MALNATQLDPASAATSDLRCRITGLRRPVADLARAIKFYVEGLGFEVESPTSTSCTSLLLGHEKIELVEVVAMHNSGPSADGPDVRFQHAAIVVSDMAAAYQRLLYLSPHCISCEGPQRLPVASGGVVAFKFRDPDGHPLELIGFPPGMGNARWHGRGRSGATIGIDHFALSVSAIEQSIAFYQRTFGFNIDARQVNSGPEQGRLDGLKAPIVEIVAMSSGESDTPHLELLAYRQPSARTYDHCLVDNVVDCLIFERTATFVDELASRLDTDPDCHVFKVDCPSRPLYES